MILCATCGKENASTGSYCRGCGNDLRVSSGPRRMATARAVSPAFAFVPPGDAKACAACRAPVPEGFAFCGSCGTPVEANVARSGTIFFQAQETPKARLVAIEPDGTEGASWNLGGDEAFAGRSAGPVLLPDDPYVSPKHCRFYFDGGRLQVEDLNSTNGVYRRVRGETALQPGDQLRLGRQLLRIEPMDPAPAQASDGTRMWGSPDPGYRARLIQVLEGGGVGEVFPLEAGDNLVGREVGDVTFPGDRFVSGRHAVVSVAVDGVRIRDLGSSNGTFVRLTAPFALDPGDALLLGARLLRVEMH